MTKKTRILTGLLVCVLVVCAGLATGTYFQNKKPSVRQADDSVASMAIAPGKATTPNSGVYDVSPPNIGVTLTTYNIDIKPLGTVSYMPLPKTETEDIRPGQKIFFYDAQGMLLETLGEVTKVTAGSDQMKDFNMVFIALNADDTVIAETIAKGKIITGRNGNSQRLPLTALVKNDKGESYVWEITDNKNGTATVALIPANVAATTYDYFVIEQAQPASNIYVLNPDDKLQDGQTIKINSILYAAPNNMDEEHITTLMMKRSRDRTEKINAEMNAINGVDPSTMPSAEATAGCPSPPPGAADSFIQQIENLTPQGSQSLPTSR